MTIMHRSEIRKKFNDVDKLVISPLLDDDQIGPASVDLRVGTEFKVMINSRSPVFGVIEEDIDSFYQTTYRNFGEDIYIYPGQQVLAVTFEYIRIPLTCFGQLFTRSSLQRLGLSTSSIIQPGYTGTLTVPLENKGNTPIVLKSGMRLFQLVLFDVSSDNAGECISYTNTESKYVGDTSPAVSGINSDADLKKLAKFIY